MRTSLSQQIQGALIYTTAASRKLIEAQNHAVSGKRIMKPSDDVVGTARALSLRSSINTVEQYANNITVSKPILVATQQVMQDLAKQIRAVRNIAIEAGKEDYSGNAKDAYIRQLEDILDQMVDLANTKHTDQYIFSGTKTDVPAVQATGGTPPYAYMGDNGVRSAKVLAWVSLPLNVPGKDVFNFGATGEITDVFTMVTQLRDAIRSGDVTTISKQLNNIDANLDNLLAHTARVGSWLARMENAENALRDMKNRFKEMLSDAEDIDLPTAVVELKTQENVYQTALSITSRMLDLSLASLKF